MGKAISNLKRPLRNFNVENRAHKVISQVKPVPAPKYESDIAEYQRILKEHPEIVEDSLKKHEALDKHLRDVYVTSKDPNPEINTQSKSTSRPLPENRTAPPQYDLGYKEPDPDQVPVGKATLKTIMKFISMYRNNPEVNTSSKIALEYNLDKDKVEKVLKYVNVYEMYIPQQRETNAKFVGPVVPRIKITKSERPKLGSGKKNPEPDDT